MWIKIGDIDSDELVATEVSSISSIEGLTGQVSAWSRLTDALPDAHFATLFPAILANAQYRSAGKRWYCYINSNNRGLIDQGLFGHQISIKLKWITVPTFRVGTEHHSNIAVSGSSTGDLTDLLRTLLSEQADRRCLVEFSNVDALALRLLEDTGLRAGLRYTWSIANQGCYFDTSQTFENLQMKFGRKLARNLKRERRRLESEFQVELQTTQTRDVATNIQLHERYMDMEAAGWKGRSSDDMRSKERDYYRSIVEQGADLGSIRWYTLNADRKAIAMYFCYQHQGTIWALKTSFDESLSQYSPGSELLHRMLRDLCCEPGIFRLHMMTSPPWLAKWGPSREQYYRFRLFNHSFKSFLLYCADRANLRLKDLVTSPE